MEKRRLEWKERKEAKTIAEREQRAIRCSQFLEQRVCSFWHLTHKQIHSRHGIRDESRTHDQSTKERAVHAVTKKRREGRRRGAETTFPKFDIPFSSQRSRSSRTVYILLLSSCESWSFLCVNKE